MSDSDEEYGFSGNHMAGNHNSAGVRGVGNSQSNGMKNLDYDYDDFGPNDNDLKLEDDWDYRDHDNYNQQQTHEPKTSYQEMKMRQKDKLTKKTYTNADNTGSINYDYRRHQPEGPGLDDIYENKLKPQTDQYDKQLEGEIQHKGLKENLDEYRNHKVEYVAEDPSKILNKQNASDQNYGMVNQVDIDGAEVSTGLYNDGEKPRKKKKKKKKKLANPDDQILDENGIESTQLEYSSADQNQKQYEEYGIDGAPTDPSSGQPEYEENHERKKKKKKRSSKHPTNYEEEDKIDSNEMIQEPPQNQEELEEPEGYGISPGNDEDQEGEQEGEGDHERRSKKKKKDRKSKKEKRNKRKEEILKIKNAFMEKLISPFTDVNELVNMFMQPLPKEVGILECTIMRNKSGFNFWNPKYTLVLSDGERFLLNAKKRGGNKTSNYLITLDQDNLKKKGEGYLGKLRANFMGTEFIIYDQGENPKKCKNVDNVRREMASVLYESNVLGSKGPRKMRVIIPAIDKDDNI